MGIRGAAVLLLLAAAPPATAMAAPAKIALIAPSPPILAELSETIEAELEKQGFVAERDFTAGMRRKQTNAYSITSSPHQPEQD